MNDVIEDAVYDEHFYQVLKYRQDLYSRTVFTY